MPTNDSGDEAKDNLTLILQAEQNGCSSEQLLPLVYDELRRVAAMRLASEMAGQTLQPTALVHEAWLRLFGTDGKVWQNRKHFFRAAAHAMRQILTDRARRKLSLKRGSRPAYVSIDDIDVADELPEERVLMIDAALERLQQKDQDLAQVVILKFFVGLTNAEVAEITGVTERTVQNKWNFAKAWLIREIEEEKR